MDRPISPEPANFAPYNLQASVAAVVGRIGHIK
jgi:hypothetical protein